MRGLICLAIVLFANVAAYGQKLSGVVVDTHGAAVQNSEVVVTDRSKVIERTTTDAEGRFSLASRFTAQATLTVRAKGFADFSETLSGDPKGPMRIVLTPAGVSEQVTVSVTRSETSQSNTAASIAVINIDSLDVTAARTVDDTLRQIAGFQLFRRSSSRTTNPTAQGPNLRGLSGSGASRASVLFDGLSLNDAFGGWTYWSRVPLIAVEQIEVLRGGGSSFYGSGGLSGAVNIVPLKLDDEKVRFKFETSLASQTTADASGTFLVSHGPWEANFIGEIFKTDGYIPVEGSSRGLVDTRAASRHSNAIFKIGRRFGEKSRAFIRGNIFGERRENGTSLTNNRTYFRQLAFGADLGTLSVRVFGERPVYDQTFSAVSADRNTENLTRIQRVPSSAYGGSIFWKRTVSRHSLAASGEFLNARGFSDEVGFFNGRATSVGHSGGEARDISFFIADAWAVARRLMLNLSARYDHRRNFDGVAMTRTLSTGAIVETRFADRDESAFSPRVGVVYEVNENVSLYGAFSRSFRAPSLNELYRGFRVGNIVTDANAFLTAENANTFEAGGSAAFFNRKLITRASAYSTRVSDPVVSVTTATTPTLITRQRRNVGSTSSRGLEIEVESSPTTHLGFNTSYLYVDAKITDFPADRGLEGNLLPQVPRHNFAAQIRYDFRDQWTISTQLRAASSQFEDDRNTLRLRKYFTADARIAYKFPRIIEVFAAAENIFDSRYDIALTPVRSVAAPRSLRIGLRFDLSKR